MSPGGAKEHALWQTALRSGRSAQTTLPPGADITIGFHVFVSRTGRSLENNRLTLHGDVG